MNKVIQRLKHFRGNPVYTKETKLRVRTIKFAFTIFFFNLALIIIALFGFEAMFNIHWNQYIDYSNAAVLYLILIVMETGMVMFLVPAFTAGSIAGEREKQTLDILLTTTLKPSQIVWGKLISSLSMVLLLIISSLPVLSIVFTIGGIRWTDLLQFVIATFIFSLLVGSIGVWASAMIKRTVPATVFTYGGILLLGLGSVVIVGAIVFIANLYDQYNVIHQLNSTSPDISLSCFILLINPGCTLLEMIFNQYAGGSVMQMINQGMGGSMPSFIITHWSFVSLLVQLVMAVLMMQLAARALNPLRERKEKRRRGKRRQRKQTEHSDGE